MIRPEDARIAKMMEAFEDLGLNPQELEDVEKYLRDEAGEEVLEQLTFRDLEQISAEAKNKCREACNSFYTKKRYEELAKIFKVLFAVGQSTCGMAFTGNISMLKFKDFQDVLNMHPAKLVAVYAHFMANTRWFCRVHTLEGFYELAGYRPENLSLALEYCKGNAGAGKLLLYTIYFWKKYASDYVSKKTSGTKPVQTVEMSSSEPAKKGGFLNTLTKLFGGKAAEENITEVAPIEKVVSDSVFEGQDAFYMKNYEDILGNSIGALFTASLAPDLVSNLQAAIRKGEMPPELLNRVKGMTLNERMLEILGGCAYMNYQLSEPLKAVVTLCAATEPRKTLEVMSNMDGRSDMQENGGNYDRIFGMDTVQLIAWAANTASNHFGGRVPDVVSKKVLSVQFQKNPTLFLEYMKTASLDETSRMMEIIKEADAALYKSMMGNGMGEQKEKVIQALVERISAKADAQAYLRGEAGLADLYKVEGNLMTGNRYGGGAEWRALQSFHERYQDRDFFNRAMILMSLCEMSYFFRQVLKNAVNRKEEEMIFAGLQEGGLDVEHQLHTLIMMTETFYHENDKNKLMDVAQPIFLQYLKERPEETKQAFANGEALARYFGLCVMEQEAENYKAEILGFSQDTAKVVKEKLEEILKKQTSWREEITALLASKKAAERELAIRVLLHWNTPEDIEALRKLLETEKNAKVRNLLESTLQIGDGSEGETAPAKVLSKEELVKNLHKGGKKRGLAWAYETPFSEVHKTNGELAEEEYLQAILLCYTGMTNPGVSKDAAILAQELNEAELALYMNELFDKWLEAGAESKKRWVMYAASIHGGSDIVKKLNHQIQEWPQHARGAIAADAVQALALNPQPQALLLVDGIARKFKFKQVKAAAGKALEYAAEQLGLTREELEDKIVPNLGFDENMERRFDYGERSFIVTITPALEIEITGEDGKKLKNLPAPGKKDDEEKANAAYEAFKEMKKQMKTTISSQKARLEAALSSERLWSISAWQDLFVKNPVMHQFAIGLIWGIYEEHQLTQSFRYMEDGSFNTEEEDEYTLPEQGYIGLVHPIELSQESKDAWKQQLEDYEIVQPFEQLSREIFYPTEEELKGKSMERFGGMYVNDLSLNGKMLQLGWYRGDALDAGCFDTFYRTDASVGLTTELHFSGTYIGCEGEDVTVYEARFYKIDEGRHWGYNIADEAKDTKALMLKDIPVRYFSEIVLQLTKATASSKEKDENWKKDRR
ncbi:MAG: DUF4132 domain-containing protein [Lachnospiraceae bacterium]|nr:DUF4132 domain-containing protein [Lachnospiraceae bacterium]